MNKFSVNYADLQATLNKKTAYRLADVKHRLQKVAFDVVRFVDSDKIDDLWKIERDGDDEYIVAMYDEDLKVASEASTKTASANPWNVISDDSGNIHVFYKNAPIKRLALAQLGLQADDAISVCRLMKTKFASDASFLGKFLNELTESEREALTEVEPSIAGK